MTDAASWRKRAAELRQTAQSTREAERERVLLVLAEDCEEIAKALESSDGDGDSSHRR